MIIHPLTPSTRALHLLLLSTLLLAGAGSRALAQTTIATASFNSDGTVNSANSYTLDTFLVTGSYYGASPSTAYISDGSGVSGRIYGSAAVAQLTVGSEYTATITTSAFGNSEEFTTATNIAPAGMLTAIAVPGVSPSSVSTTSPVPLSPSAGTYNSLLYSAVTFNLTPQTDGALNTDTSTNLVTDAATGAVISFYRSEVAETLTAGQTYAVTGVVQSYKGDAEIVSANATPVTAAIPEPGAWTACLLGGAVLAGVARRRGLRP